MILLIDGGMLLSPLLNRRTCRECLSEWPNGKDGGVRYASVKDCGSKIMRDLSKKGPRDPFRINLNEERDVRYWTLTFGISRDRLELVVKQVGISVDKVRAELGKQ